MPSKQTNEDKKYERLQSTLREVQLEREALRAENALFRKQLEETNKRALTAERFSKKLSVAFIQLRDAMSTASAALAIDNINPVIDTFVNLKVRR